MRRVSDPKTKVFERILRTMLVEFWQDKKHLYEASKEIPIERYADESIKVYKKHTDRILRALVV